jgi:hypothetical protein
MRKWAIAAAASLSLAGCVGDPPPPAPVTGAAVGAATGALIGGAATGRVGGALAGAAIGGATGAIIGAAAGRPGYCQAYDPYGNIVVIQCPPGYAY